VEHEFGEELVGAAGKRSHPNDVRIRTKLAFELR
jgi:hypothetical protein